MTWYNYVGREFLMRFVTGRSLSSGEVRMLTTYASLASTHLRNYLESLNERQRLVMEPYALPPLPAHFLERYAQHRANVTAAAARRKEQSDVLAPLLPLLIELAQFRKQEMERLYTAFCRYRDQACAGRIPLPYRFQYTDRCIFRHRKSHPTVAAVLWSNALLLFSLTFWTRATWVAAHPSCTGAVFSGTAADSCSAYAAEKELYFLQYEGAPCTICSGVERCSPAGRVGRHSACPSCSRG